MLAKFETKSNRVKGLTFHAKRPWVLASLHSGAIHLWDYQIGTLVDKFEEHEGPVRGIDFHPNQPLFVSGGDDYKIKVWNWKQRRCLFTLNGHLDYIRTVFFHKELPWIISASDDQTIRIWNWQSRSCLAILTGHNHYVMCAQFHLTEDLIVSASMDQTVRVWDFSGLKKKHSTAGARDSIGDPRMMHYSNQMREQQLQDPFGNMDVVVKFVLEGHERGVNWASFHPKMPLIVSGGDDRILKLWRMNESKAWAVDTCRGHYNNVSCVVFHPKSDLILSNSEDKTVRIWDLNKRSTIQTLRRENDRFWVITSHPELNIFAAGHDHGLVVFKLERERPAMTLNRNVLYFVKDKYIRAHDLVSKQELPAIAVHRNSLPGQHPPPKSLSFNAADNSIMMTSEADGGVYFIYSLPTNLTGQVAQAPFDAQRGPGGTAMFISRNKFAVCEKTTNTVRIKDSTNTQIKDFPMPPNATEMLHASPRNYIFGTPTSVILYDSETRTVLSELLISGPRYLSWTNDGTMVAIMSKHVIIFATKDLQQLGFIHETIKIKGACWDDSGVLIYSTLNHIKFSLPNGDNGIIKTIEAPVYPVKVMNNQLIVLSREAEVQHIPFDPTEYLFKQALISRNYDRVLEIIRTSNLVGQSIISYLEKKGYPEVALQFVKEPKTRFELALECGNIDVALETAKVIDKEEVWNQLGAEALSQGNHQIVEMVYQRTKSFDKLSNLYLLTGNVEKLKKMHKIAELRQDTMSRYHNAMILGDIEDQISMLKDAGQYSLAYLMAQTHGLQDEAQSIAQMAGISIPPPVLPQAQLLKTPTPILKQFDQNWPLLPISRNIFETSPGAVTTQASPKANVLPVPASVPSNPASLPQAETDNVWDDTHDDFAPPKSAEPTGDVPLDIASEEGGWGMEDDFDIPADLSTNGYAVEQPSADFTFNMPSSGLSRADHWVRNSGLAIDHAAAGSFESAMQLLNRQVGAINFAPLKDLFMNAWIGSKAVLPANSTMTPLTISLVRNPEAESSAQSLPYIPYNLQTLQKKLDEGYTLTTGGKFQDALAAFRGILHQVLVTIVQSETEAQLIASLVTKAREYIIGLSMELARRELNVDSDPKRVLEMATYFTHCEMESVHLQLALRSAMAAAYKMKNYATAYSLSCRLLESGPPAQLAQLAKKIQIHCEKLNRDEIPIEYDRFNPFVVCGASFTPIHRGSPSVSCSYCTASFKPEFAGSICTVCQISQIGGTGTGLRNVA